MVLKVKVLLLLILQFMETLKKQLNYLQKN